MPACIGVLVDIISPNTIHSMNQNFMTLEDRLRALLSEVLAGSYSVEEATLLLRGEVLAGFFRGAEAQKKRPQKRRFPHR